ncbi:MAG: hypothetical protein O3C10_13290, partial [Chloroflexi bacterium]|nr:hypothetical protein [Chloroflexota bacterium]
MIHNRNAQAAMLVTAIGVTAVIGWIVVASLVFDGGPTNLAADILSGAGSGDGQVRKIVVDGAKIPLIHDVSMSITRACWTRSRLSATASTILPGGPERRFLMVDYEITNESDGTISFEGFVNLFNIVRCTAVVATGGD